EVQYLESGERLQLDLERKETVLNGAIVATDSHLGRSKGGAITRPSLIKELAARGIRMTSQRSLLVSITQGSSRHLDEARLLEIALKQDAGIDLATVDRTMALVKEHGLIDELDFMHTEGEID